jgi:hypothetical protein
MICRNVISDENGRLDEVRSFKVFLNFFSHRGKKKYGTRKYIHYLNDASKYLIFFNYFRKTSPGTRESHQVPRGLPPLKPPGILSLLEDSFNYSQRNDTLGAAPLPEFLPLSPYIFVFTRLQEKP